MTNKPILNVIVNSQDAKSISKSIPQIREAIDVAECKFPIEANLLLGFLLDKAEYAANMKLKR